MQKLLIPISIFILTSLNSFAQVNLSAGLVAYWDFNGNANDVSGTGNNGIVYGATLAAGQAGVPNTAYAFNGSSDYIRVPNSASLNFPNDSFTMYALVKPQGFYTGPCHGNIIIDKNGDYNPGWYSLRYADSYSSSFLNCSSPVNTAEENFTAGQFNLVPSGTGYTPYINVNTWYCLVAISDGITSKLYMNGVLVHTQNLSGPNGVNTADLYIGRLNSAVFPYWLNGLIDEIRLYNRAINIDEVHALCGCDAATPISNLMLNNDTTLCLSTPVQLHANTAIDTNSTYWWTPTTTLNDSTSLNPIATPSATTTYYFNVLNKSCNLIDNGNFESGYIGFSSQYNYAAINTLEGEFTVANNPQAWNGGLGAFGDHTTGTGNMMIVNGAPLANTNVWCKTVNVNPGADYAFSAWIMNANTAGVGSNPPTLQFSINGVLIGSPFTASTSAGLWQQFYQTWNSGTSTSATICIVNQNTIAAGNDFAIDDISFSPFVLQTDSVTITIANPVNVTASPSTTLCSGSFYQLNASGASTYVWSPSTSLSNASISNPIASPNTTTTYTVTGSNASGCSNTATVTITVNPSPTVTATASPSSLCVGSPTTLTATGANTYTWSGGILNGVPFNPSSTTTYTVTGTDANGCSNTSTVTVNLVNNLVVSIVPNDPILCLGDSIQLVATGANSYQWLPNASINATFVFDPIVYPSSTTTYTVTGTDASGCTGTSSVTINVMTDPHLTVSKSGDVECNQHTIVLSASGASSYTWWPSSFLSAPNSAVTNAMVNTPTTFIVTGTVGSCIVTDSIHVDVYNNDESMIYIPNAFTPNGDGNNDCLRILNSANFIDYYFAIYNRWGQRVFESDDPNTCWDGLFKNKEANTDVYYYYLDAKTVCGKIFKKGDITLLR